MKIYGITIDYANPAPAQIYVSPYSDYKIGLDIKRSGTSLSAFTVKLGDQTLSPDETKTAQYTTFTRKSGAPGTNEYVITSAGKSEKLRVKEIVTDSTVFYTDEAGDPIPADLSVSTLSANSVRAGSLYIDTSNEFSAGCINATDVYCFTSSTGSQASLQTGGSDGMLVLDDYSFTGADLKCPRLETAFLEIDPIEAVLAVGDYAGYFLSASTDTFANVYVNIPSLEDPWEIYLEFSNAGDNSTTLEFYPIDSSASAGEVECASGKKTTIYLRSCGNHDADKLICYKVAETSI